MSRLNFIDRLQTGEVLVMEGATGSELQRRGVDVDKASVEGKLGVWSAAANLDAPHVVRAIHEDYLNAGAEIIISNNFYTSRRMMEVIGSLPRLRDAYGGPVGAYAHLEYNENPKFVSSADESFFTLGQGDYTPERYADVAVGWKEMGAQIIGGGCATTPDHIRAVRAAVKP